MQGSKGVFLMKKTFFCHDQGCHVACNAPLRCDSQCEQYRAERITAVKKRRLCSSEALASVSVLTGFIRGCQLIVVQE